MGSFFKLIRIQNLVLIIAIQYCIRYFLMRPLLGTYGYGFLLSDALFALLVGTTVLLTASGYVINDYFDIRIDQVNKPGHVLVGRSVKRRIAMFAHFLLTTAALAGSFFIAYKIGVIILGVIFLFSAGLIWFYSTNYKRQFLVGNIVMAFLTALIIIIVPLFEPRIFMLYFAGEKGLVQIIMKVIGVYVFIGFVLTFMREIVKDIYEVEGDRGVNSSTMPIVLGIQKSKILVMSVAVLLIGCIAYVQVLQFRNAAFVPFFYVLLFVQIPLVFVIYRLWKASEKNDYPVISNILNLIFISGIFSIPILYYFS